MKRHHLQTVNSPFVELECGGHTVQGVHIEDASKNPNFPGPKSSITLDLVGTCLEECNVKYLRRSLSQQYDCTRHHAPKPDQILIILFLKMGVSTESNLSFSISFSFPLLLFLSSYLSLSFSLSPSPGNPCEGPVCPSRQSHCV